MKERARLKGKLKSKTETGENRINKKEYEEINTERGRKEERKEEISERRNWRTKGWI